MRSGGARFWRATCIAAAMLVPQVAALAQPPGDLDKDVMAILGQPADSRPAASGVAAKAQEIDSKLRCPVCQGVSIADSPSGMATKMRGQVRDLVAAGYSEDQVLNYFEHSYGEFVRLEPPLRGLNWLLWSMPAIILVGGGLFVFARARRPGPLPSVVSIPPSDPPGNVDPEVARYLDRVRRDSGLSS